MGLTSGLEMYRSTYFKNDLLSHFSAYFPVFSNFVSFFFKRKTDFLYFFFIRMKDLTDVCLTDESGQSDNTTNVSGTYRTVQAHLNY